MNLETWNQVRSIFREGLKTTSHYAFASVDAEGNPHITPIGSLALTEPGKGYYFELFTTKMKENFKTNQRVCIMAVNGGFLFWLRSLMRGRFLQMPAVRLYGRIGERREATPREIARWRRIVRFARPFKGYKLLWGKISHVRDIHFDDVDPVKLGTMTRDLWKA